MVALTVHCADLPLGKEDWVTAQQHKAEPSCARALRPSVDQGCVVLHSAATAKGCALLTVSRVSTEELLAYKVPGA